MNTEFYWVAVAITIIISSARLTRALVHDAFPPTLWLRTKWGDLMDRSPRTEPWANLMFCQWCASFWVTLFVVGAADLCGVFDGAGITDSPLWSMGWWILFGSLAASYLAAIFVTNDTDKDV